MKKHGNARRLPLLILALILCLAGCAIPMKQTDGESGTKDPGTAAQTTAAPAQPLPAEGAGLVPSCPAPSGLGAPRSGLPTLP